MRNQVDRQLQIGMCAISDIVLNLNCRDEIVPIMAALQHIYGNEKLRSTLMDLVHADINKHSSSNLGREGLGFWQIVVLAAMRLGCNLDYDKLQDLCDNHRNLRCLLQVSEFTKANFSYRRIRDTLSLLSPETLAKVNQTIVGHGQELHGAARAEVRADSFVIETNIHYPTDSSLIWDGLRKLVPLCATLAHKHGETLWRQSAHQLKNAKKHVDQISRASASKSPRAKEQIPTAYQELIELAEMLTARAKDLVNPQNVRVDDLLLATSIGLWIDLTDQVCNIARRRVLNNEKVPNDEKLFSLFEQHTQLYQRGKAGEPVQFGRLMLVFEDSAGFISHFHVMERNEVDSAVIVEQTKIAQAHHQNEIVTASFDRGFYTKENVSQLSNIVKDVCMLPRNPQAYARAMSESSETSRRSLHKHSGVESAIGALQRGNGLKRCRDESEDGFKRYCALAVLGRNFHTLGKLLLQRLNPKAPAAITRRDAA